jgi:hypothetical protein
MKSVTALAAAVGLASFSLPSQAIVYSAGDALLVPLAVWFTDFDNDQTDDVNTLIEVTIPSAIGHEDLANIYTARVSTPTNADLSLDPDPDLAPLTACPPESKIRWFWFDYESKKQKNGNACVSADDVVQINWRLASGETYNGVPGYMVIATDEGSKGNDANFAMFGEAYLVSGVAGYVAHTPVLPLRDEADGVDATGARLTKPTREDNVKWAGGVPVGVSPLISGMRNSYTDGVVGDLHSFDLMLSDRAWPTIHVVWFDQNNINPLTVNVYDTQENTCSDYIPLGYEVNVTWIEPTEDCGGPCGDVPLLTDDWSNNFKYGLCEDTLDLDAGPENVGGFANYLYFEPDDDGSMNPTSSMVAWAIKYAHIPDEGAGSGPDLENKVWAETAIGHDRGMFK